MTPSERGGLDFRVVPRGKGILIAGAGGIAMLWTGAVVRALLARTPLPLGTSLTGSLVIAVLLLAFAAWCAFAAESWHVAPNCFEHRVGIGRWTYVRRYRDGELVVITRFSGKWGTPYYRLYLVTAQGRRFLMERGLGELEELAELIAKATGWRAP